MAGKMDYIYVGSDGEALLIENVQRDVRRTLIEQYINCRKDKGITQMELSKRTGFSQPNITRFESGNYNPSLEMLVKMAEALDMNLEIGLTEKS